MGKPQTRAIRLERIKKEIGVTSISVNNIYEILLKGYEPVLVCHDSDFNKANWLTKFYFTKPNSDVLYYFLATGFSSGYFGEGSREFSKILVHQFGLFDRDTVDNILINLESNNRLIIMLSQSFKRFVNINITNYNINQFTHNANLVGLHSKAPKIIKAWDKSLLQAYKVM